MNKTQRPQVMHKVILQAILKQFLTLATEILNKNYWVTRPSLSCPCWQTQGLTKGFSQLNWCHRLSGRLQQIKSSRTRRRAACGHPGLLGDLLWLVSTEAPQATLVILLVSLKHNPQLWFGIIVNSSPCGLILSQEVGNIRQSTSPGLVIQSKKLDASVDIKLSNNHDLMSLFRKAIGDKLSGGSSQDLYLSISHWPVFSPRLLIIGRWSFVPRS